MLFWRKICSRERKFVRKNLVEIFFFSSNLIILFNKIIFFKNANRKMYYRKETIKKNYTFTNPHIIFTKIYKRNSRVAWSSSIFVFCSHIIDIDNVDHVSTLFSPHFCNLLLLAKTTLTE